MYLTVDQLNSYRDNGYVFLPGCFSEQEIGVLRAELPSIFAANTPMRVVEKDRQVVRSVYGTHLVNELFWRLSRHPRLVEPSMQILDSQVYVYQFKINAKAAAGGDLWQWHQDYIFWMKEDGLPSPRIVTSVIFMDDVNEFNGPLFLIPGSHKEGVIDVPAGNDIGFRHRDVSSPYGDSPAWISNLTADLKYSLSREIISRLVQTHGIVAPKGKRGSVLFFHGNLVHGSPNNISPFDRALVLVSFSSTDNTPADVESPRPEFIASRNCEAIVPTSDHALHPTRREELGVDGSRPSPSDC